MSEVHRSVSIFFDLFGIVIKELRIMRPLARFIGIDCQRSITKAREMLEGRGPSNVSQRGLTHRPCSGSTIPTTPARYQKKFQSLLAWILPGSFAQPVRHSANVSQTNSTGCLSGSRCPVQLWLVGKWRQKRPGVPKDYKLSWYTV